MYRYGTGPRLGPITHVRIRHGAFIMKPPYTMRVLLVAAMLFVSTRGASAQAATPATSSTGADSAAVAAVVSTFHNALAAGDSARALSLLDTAVLILESGDQERLPEYRARHLPADIEFARSTHTTSTSLQVSVRGDVAWVATTGTTLGNFRGRAVNSSSAELMVLARVGHEWRIAAIHWSSHARR